MPNIAIIGASKNRQKFGNKSVRAHKARGWTVFPIHPNADEIEALTSYSKLAEVPESLDRVALYVPPSIGIQVLDDIAGLGPVDVYVNPGAGSPELWKRAEELGIKCLDACAIVAIGESPSSYP